MRSQQAAEIPDNKSYIHLVEDSAVQRNSFMNRIRGLGFEVIGHENAEAFLRYLEQNDQALYNTVAIVTDYNMGEMNGGKLVEILRAKEKCLTPPLSKELVILGISMLEIEKERSGNGALGVFERAGATGAYNKAGLNWGKVFLRHGIISVREEEKSVNLSIELEQDKDLRLTIVEGYFSRVRSMTFDETTYSLSRTEGGELRHVGSDATVDGAASDLKEGDDNKFALLPQEKREEYSQPRCRKAKVVDEKSIAASIDGELDRDDGFFSPLSPREIKEKRNSSSPSSMISYVCSIGSRLFGNNKIAPSVEK